MPGAGKTIITSIVVDFLLTKFRHDTNVGIAYLYFNFRIEQKPQDLLASLLKQLIQRRAVIPECVIEIHKRHKSEGTRPSFDEILGGFRSVACGYGKIFVVLDALDEFKDFTECRKFLTAIFDLQAETKMSLFATSRFIPELEKEFEGSVFLEIDAKQDDVRKYLNSHLSRLPSFVSRNPDLQDEIKTGIIQAVRGM
jgi:hypothetical protein